MVLLESYKLLTYSYTTHMLNVRGWIKSVCFEIVIIVMGKFFKEEASLRLK